MYTQFFGLREKPFSLTPNPAYLFLSSRHHDALAYLEYGLFERIGFLMLTGDIGTGKTTLARHMLNRMDDNTEAAVLFNVSLQSKDLVFPILERLESPPAPGTSREKALELLYELLIRKYAAGKEVILMVDEAQNLSRPVLEEIRMLSNLQTDHDPLLQIMIIGQPELRETIRESGLVQFAQRIAASCHLTAMDREETWAYVRHRMATAGADTDIFSPNALEGVFEASTGIPRTINLICDAALVYAYADNLHRVTEETVSQVIREKGGIGLFLPQADKIMPGTQPEQAGSPAAPAAELAALRHRMDRLEKHVSGLHKKLDQFFTRLKKTRHQ